VYQVGSLREVKAAMAAQLKTTTAQNFELQNNLSTVGRAYAEVNSKFEVTKEKAELLKKRCAEVDSKYALLTEDHKALQTEAERADEEVARCKQELVSLEGEW